MTEVIWSEPAIDDLDRIDAKMAQRIQRAVRQFASDREGDVKKLAGKDDLWRLRVGNYRVMFIMSRDTVTVARVVDRSRAYR